MTTTKSDLKWRSISKNIKLDETTIRKNQNRVNWEYIIKYQELSSEFLDEFSDRLDEYSLWGEICQYQTLSQDFILTHRAKLDWDLLLEYNALTERYIPNKIAKVYSVTDLGGVLDVRIDFNDISKEEFEAVTQIEFFGSTNNNGKQYTTDESYGVSISGNNWERRFYDTLNDYNSSGAVGYVLLDLPDDVSGESTCTFLENPLIFPYIHKNNDLSKPFRTALYKGQTLSADFITTYDSKIDFDLLSRYVPLSEHFIFHYDNNSTLPGSTPSYDFNWEYMLIEQSLKYSFTAENSWVAPILNAKNHIKQLALKYQNLPESYISSNISDFNLTDLGKYNKNTADAMLLEYLASNPTLSGTAQRSSSIKLNYGLNDILSDLKAAGFTVEGDKVIGYVRYIRNGSPRNIRSLNFNVDPLQKVKTTQVELDQENELSRIGIIVENGSKLVDEDRKKFKIAKIETEIRERVLDSSSTGWIRFPSKNSITNGDIFVIHDGDKEYWYEFVVENQESGPIMGYFYDNFGVFKPSSPHTFKTGDALDVDSFYGTGSTAILYAGVDSGGETLKFYDTRYRAKKGISPSSYTSNEAKSFISKKISKCSLNESLIQTQFTDVIWYSPLVSVSTSENTIEVDDDLELITGDPVRLSGTLPTPLLTTTTYYVIKEDQYTFKLASTIENAIDNIAIDLTTTGSGTIFLKRYDDIMIALDPINLVSGQEIFIATNTSGADTIYDHVPTTLPTSNLYYVYKISKNKFKLAYDLHSIKYENFISIRSSSSPTGDNRFFRIYTNNIPINISDLDSESFYSTLERTLNSLTKVSLASYNFLLSGNQHKISQSLVKDIRNTTLTITDQKTTVSSIDITNSRLTLSADIGIQTGDPVSFECTGNLPITRRITQPIQTVGSGPATISSGGYFTGTGSNTYTIEIHHSGIGFRYKKNAGSWIGLIYITGLEQNIGDGIWIKFAYTSGYTGSDQFEIYAGYQIYDNNEATYSEQKNYLYYARRLTPTTIELYESPYDLSIGNQIQFCDTFTGTLTIYAAGTSILENIKINNGDRVIFDAHASLPSELTATTQAYFMFKTDSGKICFAQTKSLAKNRIPIMIKSLGTGSFTAKLRDLDLIRPSTSNYGVFLGANHHKGIAYFETVDGSSFSDGNTLNFYPNHGGGSGTTITKETIDLSFSDETNRLSIENTKTETKSLGNSPIKLYVSNNKLYSKYGMIGGLEANLTDANAEGIGVVIPSRGILRAYSVTVLDPDHFKNMNF